MSNRGTITNFDYGLEIIEGLMGAGKSYYAVRRICDTIKETRRPVYTNLPLRWRVIRKYLGVVGGEELTNLIRPLKEQHWRRFLERQHQHAKFREERTGRTPAQLPSDQLEELADANAITQTRLLNQHKIHDAQMLNWFHSQHGPDIIEGSEANAIPLGAIIVIDEVQHWHPMTRQSRDPASENLQAYLTMIRHHLHWMWVITQDRSRINILFRNLAQSVWLVVDRGESRLAWGLRFKHIGLRGMGYQRYTREQMEGANPENVKPSESFTILPQLPRNKVYFRLYDSFTNVGSRRQIQKVIERARESAGLDAEGVTYDEQRKKEQQQMAEERKPSFIKRTIRRLFRTLVVLVIAVMAFAVGSNFNNNIVEKKDAESEQGTQLHNWPKFTGIVRDTPMFNGRPVKAGSTVGDRGTMQYYDPKNRSAVLIADGGYWLWRYGEEQPQPVGSIDSLQDAYQRWDAAGQPDTGPSVTHDRATGSTTMGLGDGDSLGD